MSLKNCLQKFSLRKSCVRNVIFFFLLNCMFRIVRAGGFSFFFLPFFYFCRFFYNKKLEVEILWSQKEFGKIETTLLINYSRL